LGSDAGADKFAPSKSVSHSGKASAHGGTPQVAGRTRRGREPSHLLFDRRPKAYQVRPQYFDRPHCPTGAARGHLASAHRLGGGAASFSAVVERTGGHLEFGYGIGTGTIFQRTGIVAAASTCAAKRFQSSWNCGSSAPGSLKNAGRSTVQ